MKMGQGKCSRCGAQLGSSLISWELHEERCHNKFMDDYELDFCDLCFQMTNHLDGVCQKCKNDKNKI